MKKFLKTVNQNRNLRNGSIMLSVFVLLSIIGLLFTPYDPNAMSGATRNAAPSLAHIFGCDNFGRDIFSRVLAGLDTTVLVAVVTVLIGLVFGSLLGAVTGYFGGILDELLMRFNDALASFPSILLALVVISVFDAGKYAVVVALGIVFIPSFARVVRSEVIVKKNMDYVTNCRLMGASPFRIIFLHILPNTREIILSTVTIAFNNAILAEAGLSYLGLGVQPPDPSLGRMLSEAQSNMLVAPWCAIFPGLTIILLVLSVGLIGRGLEEAGLPKPASKKLLAKIMSTGKTETSEKAGISGKTQKRAFLSVEQLSVGFADGNKYSEVIHGISFIAEKGEILGIVGESGSGKSVTSYAVSGLLPENGLITGGSVYLDGRELSSLSKVERLRLLSSDIAFIFQEPQTAFNPVYTVGEQLAEAVSKTHPLMEKSSAEEMIDKVLLSVGLNETGKIKDSYPHELSGGMRQRAVIAMAMLKRPKLLIADEPTTALDASLAKTVLSLITKFRDDFGTTVLLISHDLTVINEICDRTMVMKDGEIVESGETESIINNPQTDYSRQLMTAAKREYSVSEYAPEKENRVIECSGLSVYYEEASTSLFKKKSWKKAVDNVSFSVKKGEIFGLVGESGSGKSTVVKAICGLADRIEGKITIQDGKSPRMVFQDPFSSLNPAMRVERLLEEPLRICGTTDKAFLHERVMEILSEVGLVDEPGEEIILSKRVSELSGGQRQRVAIALALITKADIIMLDEPVSALDVTIQKQIIELLLELRAKYGITYLFVSHDIDLVRRVCDRAAVLYHGKIVETGECERIFVNPENEYTKSLLTSGLSLEKKHNKNKK